MKSIKKISFTMIFTLISLSFISTIPRTFGATSDIESYIGHEFSEESWSILYDFAGNYLEKDYTPGALSSNVSSGASDDNNVIDSKFFFTYNNLRNVQSLYIAFQNFTWDTGDETAYGCAPYQLLIQHFRPPTNDKIHIFSLNRFLGLLAYRENATDAIKNDIPDENDSLYIGWSYYSELHKYMANQILTSASTPEYFKINSSEPGGAVPIPIQETSPDTFKFGMSYQNIFLLWQKISVQEGLDQSVNQAQLLEYCSAFSIISEINFTYTISISPSEIEGYSELKTTTEYDIGELSDLWILDDNETVANGFGGAHHDIGFTHLIDLAYYNTSTSIRNRLDGNSTIPGFSLAVINNANLMIVDLDHPLTGYSGADDFVDQTGSSLGVSTKNITEAEYNFEDDPAYKIDFASKPTYILDDSEVLDAPTRVLQNNLVQTNLGLMEGFYVKSFLGTLVAKITGSDLAGLLTFFNNKIDTAQFYYLTCFPKWSGGTIYQDPTFSVYIPTGTGFGIPGYDLLVLSLLGISGISFISWKLKKRNK